MSTSFAITRKAVLPIALAALAAVSTPAAAQPSVAPNQRIEFSSNPFNSVFVGPAFRFSGLFQLSAPAHLQYSFVTTSTGYTFSLSISQPPVAPAPLAASSQASPPPAPATQSPADTSKPYELGFNFEYKPAVTAATTMQSLLFASTQPAGMVDMSLNTNGQFTDVNVQGGDGSLMADVTVQQAAAVLPVPEPLEWMFMSTGLLAAAGLARRRSARAAV
jgi:hypothetical protein